MTQAHLPLTLQSARDIMISQCAADSSCVFSHCSSDFKMAMLTLAVSMAGVV